MPPFRRTFALEVHGNFDSMINYYLAADLIVEVRGGTYFIFVTNTLLSVKFSSFEMCRCKKMTNVRYGGCGGGGGCSTIETLEWRWPKV